MSTPPRESSSGPPVKRKTAPGIRRRKGKGLTMLTAYTFAQAQVASYLGSRRDARV